MDLIALIIVIIFFLAGIIGTLLPVMPGVILIWAGMFIYGLITGFSELSASFFILQGIAVLLVLVIDYFTTALGTKRFGGSKIATWAAVFGLFVGMIFLGIPGIIFGPFLGALAGELIQKVPLKKALYASFGTLAGLLGGVFLKLVIELLMILWFFITIF